MKKQIVVLPKETSDAQCFYYKFWQNFNLYSETHEDFKNEFEIKKIHSVRCYQDYSLQRSFHSVVKLNNIVVNINSQLFCTCELAIL